MKYPNIQVVGGNYPPPPAKENLASFLRFLQFAIIAMVLLGEPLFNATGVPMPPWYATNINSNKMIVLFGSFFVLSGVINSCLATGAFEVTLNDNLVWSKLNTGLVPSGQPHWDEFLDKLDYAWRDALHKLD